MWRRSQFRQRVFYSTHRVHRCSRQYAHCTRRGKSILDHQVKVFSSFCMIFIGSRRFSIGSCNFVCFKLNCFIYKLPFQFTFKKTFSVLIQFIQIYYIILLLSTRVEIGKIGNCVERRWPQCYYKISTVFSIFTSVDISVDIQHGKKLFFKYNTKNIK